jgi:hypothetical protein
MMTSAEPAPGEEPILIELAAAGHDVRSMADLRHSRIRYSEAVPILLDWLPLVADPKLKGVRGHDRHDIS